MKSNRHTKIIELINEYDISTQEELASRLNDAGFDVTQATVSRDIRQLNLTKQVGKDGVVKYHSLSKETIVLNEKYIRVFTECFISMDMAMNILVIKTVSGMAMAVAAAIDNMQFEEVVGTIAGDDTIMCAIRSVEETNVLMNKLRRILNK